MVKADIFDVIKEEKSGSHIVFLIDENKRILPIFIGALEAIAIATGLKQSDFPRPMTYDLIASLLKAANVNISEICIETLKSATFYASIKIKAGEVEKSVDARPSDAIAIAVRVNSPIYISEEVIDTAALDVSGMMADVKGMVKGINTIISEINVKMKQVASEKGWKIPDLFINKEEIIVKSLLSEQ